MVQFFFQNSSVSLMDICDTGYHLQTYKVQKLSPFGYTSCYKYLVVVLSKNLISMPSSPFKKEDYLNLTYFFWIFGALIKFHVICSFLLTRCHSHLWNSWRHQHASCISIHLKIPVSWYTYHKPLKVVDLHFSIQEATALSTIQINKKIKNK